MRVSLKIVGASGQGIDSIGEIMAKALKRSGYCVFGYREYPSLIKGGHASYQLDISDEQIESTETCVNIVITLNHHGLERNLMDLKPGGILIHSTPDWSFPTEHRKLIERLSIQIIELPIETMLRKLGAKPILGNVLLSAFLWSVLGQEINTLKKMVGEKFAKKKDLLELNMRCIDDGFAMRKEFPALSVAIPKPAKNWQKQLLITGSKAMGLGAIHAGMRLYAGYPMTPSSPLLSFVASIQNETGIVIKQAEDEITAAQIVSGAMFMGTRALTATSGGGFDLMSETLSLNAIIENPTVFVLAQRPGPATGLPTWTGQADLLMAVNTAHGEFARLVISISDASDAFTLMNEAFNIAEEFQISVIVLTDKQIAEALYTQEPYDLTKTKIKRGLVTDSEKLKKLKSSDRYAANAKNGISPRWLPGADAATYVAQGDEHNADGTVDESSANAKAQMEKRMKKMEALKAALPEPNLFGSQEPEVLLLGWGSTKSVVLDVLKSDALKDKKIGYLHFTHLWPLKTEAFKKLTKIVKQTILIEGNYQGQLGQLLKQETGIDIQDKILKYDGRPFFYDELLKLLSDRI
ncbi:2-oxoacid:acceptor oxidoreductase subunit alpha [Candidatus Peribacteria bacterium]|nr:2-oxoacid:acceptor oxidoreductase subunit alpha [Candidatus Peribacteria bacterium]